MAQPLAEAELGAGKLEGLLGVIAPGERALEEALIGFRVGEHRHRALDGGRAEERGLLSEPGYRPFRGAAIATPDVGLRQIGAPGGAGPGILGAQLGYVLECLDGGVDPVEPQLEEADGLSRLRLNRGAALCASELSRLSGVPPAVAGAPQAGLDAGQPDEARHGFPIEAGPP